jgi:gliding motility-associated-like protein
VYLKFLYPFLLAVLLLSAARVEAQMINVTDSLALVDLYNYTNGNGWTNKTNWLSALPVGSWYGITAITNRVYSIDLRTNNLSGTLPPSIGNLAGLQSLQLDQNSISGNIPTSMGNLTSLQYLSVMQNQLTGTLPSSLGNMTSLSWLRFSDNQLSGSIPASLGNLPNLAYIDLDINQLSGSIPPSLGNLSNLYELTLGWNQLSGTIPVSLGNLTGLHDLQLDNNQLTESIPASIGNLPNLQEFTAEFNQLSGTIPVFTASADFEYLYLQNNNFTFAGMEQVAQKTVVRKSYSPQAIIPLHVSAGKLWVSVGGTPANNTYWWYYSTGAPMATIVSDSTFTPTIPGNYYVVVTNSIATDLTLYSDTTSNTVESDTINVNPKPDVQGLFVPNAFTPNGDGHNDLLRPINLNNEPVTQFRFVIFNRWGQRIFESNDPSLGWDGKMLGTDQPTGVYVWQLQYLFPQKPLTNQSGTVVLLR